MKNWIKYALLTTSLVLGGFVQADTNVYPNRVVKWIVPYSPGGTTDVMARRLANIVGEQVGQSVVVENRPGASTIIGATTLARSKPDGYTIATADSGTLAYNPALYSKLSYDVSKDFTLIGGLGRMPLMLAVNPDFPARDLKEYLAIAREKAGTVTLASVGQGSPQHIAYELFRQRTGTDILHVPYKGSAPALQDLMAGQIQSAFIDLPPSLSMIQAGKIRVLAVASPKRLPQLPDVPTMAEAGLADFEAYAWQGLIGPANLPDAVVTKLSDELQKALENPAVRKDFAELGIEPMPMKPDEFKRFAGSEQTFWEDVIRKANIKLD